eukprot:TRINITY_DN2570_c0_g3_i2.p2 TRINITY_DN2570_c0_g3~~TRINITY_DN2570_c0_g3_i2.p2  ORF type:complete len:315 (-),score=46.15 TRINITY_DN2570_c0_g3_i2:731-1675(-)
MHNFLELLVSLIIMFGLRGGKYQYTPVSLQQLPTYYLLLSTITGARSEPAPKSPELEEFQVLDNVEERRQLGALVIEAFRSEFKSDDPSIKNLYPYILKIPAPPTPQEFIQMEQEIINNGTINYLKTGGFQTPYEFKVPSVNGTADDKCSLTRYPVCARFNSEILNTFVVDIFQAIENESGKNDSIPKIDLTRYDLFHGSFFLDYDKSGVGILFNAKEYVQIDDADFPYNLGFCQQGSDLEFSPYVMNRRNIVWFKGQLGVLNVDPEGALEKLVWELLRPVDTVYESDLGESTIDVNYFAQLPLENQNEKVFIC